MAERQLPKLNVEGSTPFTRSIFHAEAYALLVRAKKRLFRRFFGPRSILGNGKQAVELHLLETLGGSACGPANLDEDDPLAFAEADELRQGVGSEAAAAGHAAVDRSADSVGFDLSPDPGTDGRAEPGSSKFEYHNTGH